MRNHINDIQHRVTINVIPIYFDTLNDLATLKYQEGKESVETQTYVANPNHPKIKSRIGNHNSYRIYDGIDAINFKQLFWEVTK
jgi:hypothetical protein